MSWYSTITPTVGQPSNTATQPFVEFLAGLPDLRQTGPVAFEGALGQPWVCVIMARRGPTGGYACDGSFIPAIDIVELVCSYSSDPGWYDQLAGQIAAFLGWVAVEEHEDRQVWPTAEQMNAE